MTEMLFPKDELYEWMYIGLRLCNERLKALNLQREPLLLQPLRDELEVRRFCLKHSGQAEDFQGAARVWWKYMVAKAKLEILWERRQITEAEFRKASVVLRHKREFDYRRTAGAAWLPPLRKEKAG